MTSNFDYMHLEVVFMHPNFPGGSMSYRMHSSTYHHLIANYFRRYAFPYETMVIRPVHSPLGVLKNPEKGYPAKANKALDRNTDDKAHHMDKAADRNCEHKYGRAPVDYYRGEFRETPNDDTGPQVYSTLSNNDEDLSYKQQDAFDYSQWLKKFKYKNGRLMIPRGYYPPVDVHNDNEYSSPDDDLHDESPMPRRYDLKGNALRYAIQSDCDSQRKKKEKLDFCCKNHRRCTSSTYTPQRHASVEDAKKDGNQNQESEAPRQIIPTVSDHHEQYDRCVTAIDNLKLK
jgi:hypothetical protein